MTLKEIKEIAKKKKVKIGTLKKDALIKAIQIAEGNSPCFKADFAPNCAIQNCLWRSDCIKN